MFTINSSFFRSKFSRHIFLIFVSATVLPVLVIALLSFNHISKQLREQSHQQSHQVSKAIGMELIRSLLLASDELGDISQDLHTIKDPDSDEILQNTFAGLKLHDAVSVISASGEITPLSGNTGNAPILTREQKQHLGLGKAVIRLRNNKNGHTDILMFRQLDPQQPAHGILLSRAKKIIISYYMEMNFYIIEHLFLSSFVLLITLIIPAIFLLEAKKHIEKLVAYFGIPLDKLDTAAFTTGKL